MRALTLTAALLALAACAAHESRVRVLTAGGFDETVASGRWLVEFYAPWCSHCKRLEPVYEEVASDLEGQVTVAKVDATIERALAARFPLRGYPTIFFIADGEVREVDVSHVREALVRFAREGWQAQEQLSFWKSPLGPIGKAKGRVIAVGSSVTRLHQWLMQEQGMSLLTATLVMTGGGMVLTLLVGVFAAWLFFPKLKED